MNIDNVLKSHGIGIGGSNIKSIQRGTINRYFRYSDTVISINEVDLTKSIVLISYEYGNNTFCCPEMLLVGELTSKTQLTIKSGGNNTILGNVSWTVIEFNNIKSIQKGYSSSSTWGQTNLNTSINAVDLNKSVLFQSGVLYSGTNQTVYRWGPYSYLLNSTTINHKVYMDQYMSCNIYWQLVEFN